MVRMGRVTRGHLAPARAHRCVATRLDFPPLAGAASLREKRRSVRAQAPMQNEFAKGCRPRRPGIAKGHDHHSGLGVADDYPADRGTDHEGRRHIGNFRPIGHDRVQRFTTPHHSFAIGRLLRGLRRAVVAAVMRLLRRSTRSDPTQRAVIREHKPTNQRHHDGDDAESAVGAKGFQRGEGGIVVGSVFGKTGFREVYRGSHPGGRKNPRIIFVSGDVNPAALSS